MSSPGGERGTGREFTVWSCERGHVRQVDDPEVGSVRCLHSECDDWPLPMERVVVREVLSAPEGTEDEALLRDAAFALDKVGAYLNGFGAVPRDVTGAIARAREAIKGRLG